MPPKRTAAPSTPSKAKKAKPAQTSIASFFSPPGKAQPAATTAVRAKREPSVVSIADSDDDVVHIDAVDVVQQVDSDEVLARKLAAEWASDDAPNGNGKASDEAAPAEKKPVAALFAKREPKNEAKPPPVPKANAEAGPSRPTKISSARAEPVDPIDFDTDSLLFRPEEVDVSKWPGGRLPYSVLVGTYVQVSRTRSRLLIVRVLTK